MTISLKEVATRRTTTAPALDGPGDSRHPDAVVWLAGRGHETADGALHIDFPMALACDQARAMHRAAAAAEVWKLMKRMPGDRFVSLPVKGDTLDLVQRSLAASLTEPAQTVVHAARIGLGLDIETERRTMDEKLTENAPTGRDGRPEIPLFERMFATRDQYGFHSRPDALLMPLASDDAPRHGQPEYAGGLGPVNPGRRYPRVTTVLSVDPNPRVALLRAAWITRHKHGIAFLRELPKSRLGVKAGLVFARDAEAYRSLVQTTATGPKDLAGIGGVPDIDIQPSMKAIHRTLLDPENWEELRPAGPTDDPTLCGELSVNRSGDGVELW